MGGFQNLCPLCSKPIVWSHNNLKAGQTAKARCSNNPENSKIILPEELMHEFCNWTGLVIKSEGGKVKICYKKQY